MWRCPPKEKATLHKAKPPTGQNRPGRCTLETHTFMYVLQHRVYQRQSAAKEGTHVSFIRPWVYTCMYYILVTFWVTTFWHKLPKATVHTYCMYSTSQISHDIIQYDTLRLFPSKGNEPLTKVYRMTPRLQTSTSGPSYFLPWNSSGAAYGGLPQNVSSLLPGVNSLLNPKSAILMFMLESSSRFSA